MIYNLISASNIIAKVQDSYNIKTSDWIGRSGNWINHCLSDLGVVKELKPLRKEVTLVDFKAELPCDLKQLLAIEINGYRIERSNSVMQHKGEGVETDVTYTVLGNNFIELETDNPELQEIEAIIHYKGIPMEYDKNLGLLLPMIPDLEIVHDAMELYLLIKILGRGYKHPVQSLSNNNEATNPYMAYYNKPYGFRKRARLSISRMDKDAYHRALASTHNLIQVDTHSTLSFNNKK